MSCGSNATPTPDRVGPYNNGGTALQLKDAREEMLISSPSTPRLNLKKPVGFFFSFNQKEVWCACFRCFVVH